MTVRYTARNVFQSVKTKAVNSVIKSFLLVPVGAKPAEAIKAVTDISAVIEDVDYVNRLVTVKGPQRTLTIKVDPQAENLNKIKKGDKVFLQINEALTINVVSPK